MDDCMIGTIIGIIIMAAFVFGHSYSEHRKAELRKIEAQEQRDLLYKEHRWRRYAKPDGTIIKYLGRHVIDTKNDLHLLELQSKKYVMVNSITGETLYVWTCYDEVDPSKLKGAANKVVWEWMRTAEFQQYREQQAQEVR